MAENASSSNPPTSPAHPPASPANPPASPAHPTASTSNPPPSTSNPSSSQTMPQRMRLSVQKAESEIEELTKIWRRNLEKKDRYLQRMEDDRKEITRMKRESYVLEERIRKDNIEVNLIIREFAVLQTQITEKQNWVDQCNELYP